MSTLEVYNNWQTNPTENMTEEYSAKDELNLPNKNDALSINASDVMGLSWLFIDDDI